VSTPNTLEKIEGYVLDTSAWIEFAKGSERGSRVRAATASKQLYMCAFSVTEACAHSLRSGEDDEMALRMILDKAVLIHVDGKLAIAAARMYHAARKKKPKFSYGDALAYVAADEHGLKLLTCDNDFLGVKNAVVVR
jgi:predicted nucleic acid-binding protein